MEFSVGQITRLFQVYQNQESLAERSRRGPETVVHDQGDRVTISSRARALVAQPPPETATIPPEEFIGPPEPFSIPEA